MQVECVLELYAVMSLYIAQYVSLWISLSTCIRNQCDIKMDGLIVTCQETRNCSFGGS